MLAHCTLKYCNHLKKPFLSNCLTCCAKTSFHDILTVSQHYDAIIRGNPIYLPALIKHILFSLLLFMAHAINFATITLIVITHANQYFQYMNNKANNNLGKLCNWSGLKESLVQYLQFIE